MTISIQNESILGGPAGSELLVLSNNNYVGYGSVSSAGGNQALIALTNPPTANPDDKDLKDVFVYNMSIQIETLGTSVNFALSNTLIFSTLGDNVRQNTNLNGGQSVLAASVFEAQISAASEAANTTQIITYVPRSIGTEQLPFKSIYKLEPGMSLLFIDNSAADHIRAHFEWYEKKRVET